MKRIRRTLKILVVGSNGRPLYFIVACVYRPNAFYNNIDVSELFEDPFNCMSKCAQLSKVLGYPVEAS